MTYKSFKASLIRELRAAFPPETTISIRKIPRNNNITLDGLTIFEAGYNIAPTIYLGPYYEKIKQGLPFPTLICELITSYHQCQPKTNIDPSFFFQFENISQQVVYKLISQKQNRSLLKEIPHLAYLDLAIVFYCLVAATASGNSTILIRNSHLKLWNTTTQKLYELARINTPRLLPPQQTELSQMLAALSHDFADPLHNNSKKNLMPMFLLSNVSLLNGAACMLYDNLLHEFGERIDSDFYILPSSIHEVLLVPAAEDLDGQSFSQIVPQVNATQVPPEDILSDHVYFYNRKEHRLSEANVEPMAVSP